MNVSSQATPSLWPVVHTVLKAFCPESEHLDVVTFIDFPGHGDSDKGRANVSHEHVNECGAIFAIDHISRATTEDNTSDLFAMYGTRFATKMAMVVTHSDFGAEADTGELLELGNVDISAYRNETRELEIARTKLKMLKKTHSTMSREELTERLTLQTDTIPQIQVRQLEALVCARNQGVVRQLQDGKARYLPAGTKLPVFCVSSRHYSLGMLDNADGEVIMSRSATGIPALLEHAMKLGGEKKFAAEFHFIVKALGVYEALALWSEGARAERPRDLEKTLSGPGKQLVVLASAFRDNTAKNLEQQLTTLLSSHRAEYHEAAMEELVAVFDSYHCMTLRAFIFEKGNHRTGSRAATWNEDVTKGQTQTIRDNWPRLLQVQKKILTDGVDDMVASIQKMFETLTGKTWHPSSMDIS